jgi:hypothetical protein
MLDVEGKAGRHPYKYPNDDFVQAGSISQSHDVDGP